MFVFLFLGLSACNKYSCEVLDYQCSDAPYGMTLVIVNRDIFLSLSPVVSILGLYLLIREVFTRFLNYVYLMHLRFGIDKEVNRYQQRVSDLILFQVEIPYSPAFR
jgi:hypothetical protein